MAAPFGDTATQVQSLVTVGTALLFSGQAEGALRMEQALRLALAHGLHEEAARVYTNHSEYAIVTGDLALAERLVLQGLAFDAKHGLDAWLGYLSGRHAQLRLEQGRWDDAQTLAQAALAVEGRTVLMRLPASIVLARLQSRRGTGQAGALLQDVLSTAQGLGEMQRIAPARLAAIEHHYLLGEEALLHSHLQALVQQAGDRLRPWDAGAVRLWLQRAGLPAVPGLGLQPTPAQALELAGDHEAAAQHLARQGLPFDAALARLAGVRAGKPALAAAAAQAFQQLGCMPGLRALQRLAGAAPPRRGPYRAARRHPLGLTAKEVQVLALMAEGASNADIATRLSRSQRTVETHVSAILDKLSASNRLEAVLRVLAEPWLVQV
jgi:ATP/maltotriose-dependent transcriptional regulator MalT